MGRRGLLSRSALFHNAEQVKHRLYLECSSHLCTPISPVYRRHSSPLSAVPALPFTTPTPPTTYSHSHPPTSQTSATHLALHSATSRAFATFGRQRLDRLTDSSPASARRFRVSRVQLPHIPKHPKQTAKPRTAARLLLIMKSSRSRSCLVPPSVHSPPRRPT